MDKLTTMIASAGLLHDIGKFAERGEDVRHEDPDKLAQDFKYAHAGYTGQIISRFWGDGALANISGSADVELNLYNLASRHHNPRNAYETLIAEADHLAAGHERRGTKETAVGDHTQGRRRKNEVPLHSILERIALEEDQGDKKVLIRKGSTQSRYALRPLLFGQEPGGDWILDDFFARSTEQYTKEQVAHDYTVLWKSFANELAGPRGGCMLDPLADLTTLYYLFKKYTWCVPESTRYQDLPDVALFDHSKATSALAVCLYQYHNANGTLIASAIKNTDEQKFLLFCGDLSGIQKFIYNVSSKGAYKALKGRSFFVQLASEVISQFYLKKLGLPVTCLLYASGGKFYILMPNLPEFDLAGLDDTVNSELFSKFGGSIFLRTGFEVLSGKDFSNKSGTSGRNLCQVWDSLTRKVALSERTRYARLAEKDYDGFFAPQGFGGTTKTCDVCHDELAAQDNGRPGDRSRCPVCRQMETIGERLRDARFIILSEAASGSGGSGADELLGFRIRIEKELDGVPAAGSTILCLNNNRFLDQLHQSGQHGGCTFAPLMLGGNHRFDRELDEVAQTAQGIKRLGVLRMDVDNLGSVFSEGLRRYDFSDIPGVFADAGQCTDFNFYSIGRITTLSFQLSFFFGAIVQNIIDANALWEGKAVIVYAGGDDLFLLGAWDVLPEIALEIRKKFSAFACGNPVFSISGGMVLVDGRFPVYKSADMAGDAEHDAKALMVKFTDGRVKEKDAFSFLGVAMNWKEFESLWQQKAALVSLVGSDGKNRGLVHRLGLIASSYQESRLEMLRREMKTEQLRQMLQAERWRWRMVYSLSRFCENKPLELKSHISGLQDFIQTPVGTEGNKSERTGIELLHVLARWVELTIRN